MCRAASGVIALLIGAGAASCSSGPRPRDPVAAFYANDVNYSSAYFRKLAERNDENLAYALDNYATAEMAAGNYRGAKTAFVDAGRLMGNFSGSTSETLGAIFGEESSKTYKGDPYEKAMNSFYAGLLCYIDGEYDNALAGCKNALLADGDVEEEKYQSDFTLIHWLEGKCLLKLGKPDAAEQAFEQARGSPERRIDNGVIEPLLQGRTNTLLVVDVGIGPKKIVDGDNGSVARLLRSAYPEDGAIVRVDGSIVGRTVQLADIWFQASTRGGREFDGILQGKAIFKDVAAIGGVGALIAASNQRNNRNRNQLALAGAALLVLSAITSSEADTRHWETLPGEVHAIALELSPGLHTVDLDFVDRGGASIPEFRQIWYHVPIRDDRENVFYFRSGPRRWRATYPQTGPAASFPARNP